MKVALIQLKLTTNPDENLSHAIEMIKAVEEADIIVLPESFTAPFGTEALKNYDSVLDTLSELAKEKKAVIVAGTVPEETEDGFYNTCYVFDKSGRHSGKYRKIHLFDVDLPNLRTCESDRYLSGDSIEILDLEGKIGLAVCYDLRFPDIFTDLNDSGAELIIVPAAFSKTTGEKHWELLNRARALDSQCYIASCAPAQNDELPFRVYAHSVFVDPDGNIINEAGEDEEILYADIDLSTIKEIRERLPVTKSRREIKNEKNTL